MPSKAKTISEAIAQHDQTIETIENLLPNIPVDYHNELETLLDKTVSNLELLKKLKKYKSNEPGDGYTLQEVADTLGLKREIIRQIEYSAIKKLRHPKVGKRIKEYIA